MAEHDAVNSPSHYTQGNKETSEVIEDLLSEEQFRGHLLGTTIKYLARHQFKGAPIEDLRKARWYLDRLIKELTKV